jgi:putative SOS response-associated peptidase YedK
MCGRFVLFAAAEAVSEVFEAQAASGLVWPGPRYNIAPTQLVTVVRQADVRRIELMRWGLVPSWSKGDLARVQAAGAGNINARVETIRDKPSFRAAFESRRCLIPANGFYEWAKAAPKARKQAHFFSLPDLGLVAFAGLWEQWQQGGDLLTTCCIVTTQANPQVAAVHHRMPLLIERSRFGAWLDPSASFDSVVPWLEPALANHLVARPVGPEVNAASHQGPGLIEPWRASDTPPPPLTTPKANPAPPRQLRLFGDELPK